MSTSTSPVGRTSSTDPGARVRAWETELDRIELDVLRAERALASGQMLVHDEWDRPVDHGPLPEELRERAEAILARQHVVLEQMTALLGATRRHQAVVDAVERASARPAAAPVYLDVTM